MCYSLNRTGTTAKPDSKAHHEMQHGEPAKLEVLPFCSPILTTASERRSPTRRERRISSWAQPRTTPGGRCGFLMIRRVLLSPLEISAGGTSWIRWCTFLLPRSEGAKGRREVPVSPRRWIQEGAVEDHDVSVSTASEQGRGCRDWSYICPHTAGSRGGECWMQGLTQLFRLSWDIEQSLYSTEACAGGTGVSGNNDGEEAVPHLQQRPRGRAAVHLGSDNRKRGYSPVGMGTCGEQSGE